MKSILIAAPSSGSGKTTISLGIMAALRKRGLTVQPFKVGPDFIDPGHHTAVCGRASRNLDGWMLSREYIAKSYSSACQGVDIAVIEGVMGLFDGADGKSEDGSSAQIAKWTGSPVILVVDARSMARSAAALISGFENFDKDLNVAGVIFNRVGSDRHKKMLKEAVDAHCKVKVLGFIPKDEGLAMPERHLGLMTAEEGFSQGFIDKLTRVIEESVELDRLLNLSNNCRGMSMTYSGRGNASPLQKHKRVAVARDKAFSFYYEDNFEILKDLGAELVFFSPLADKALPDSISGLYIGGGYPELHAEGLSTNRSMLDSIKAFAEGDGTVYAECGGFMYLTEGIIDFDGKFHQMTGVFPTRAKMLKKRKALGYVEVEYLEGGLSEIRGHEFHYSEIEEMPESIVKTYNVKKPNSNDVWTEGYRYKNILGSYVHLHFGSNKEWAERLLCPQISQICTD